MSTGRARGRRGKKERVSFAAVRKLALTLPGVTEGTSYGTPAFRVGGKLLARLREDGETLVIKTDDEDREVLLAADPQAFYITDHYVGYPWMLVRLSSVRPGVLRELLEQAWRQTAAKRLVAAFDRKS